MNDAIKPSVSQEVGRKILPSLLQCFEWENDYIKPNMQTQMLHTHTRMHNHTHTSLGQRAEI
jgi:hypothetical protein